MNSTTSTLRGGIASTVDIGRTTYENWRNARTIRLGAGLAYYALFAIVPLITLAVVVAQLLVDPVVVEDLLRDIAARLDIADESITSLIDEIDRGSTQSSLGVVGLGSLVLAGALVISALQDAFDEVWELPVRTGIKNSVVRKATAYVVVVGTGVLIVLLLVVNAVADLLRYVVPGRGGPLDRVSDLFSVVSGWVVLFAILALLYQVLTRRRIDRVALLAGSLAAAGLLAAGTWALGLYLRTYGGSSVSGAAGGVLLVLLWFYYIAQMVLVGAHFTRVLHERRTAGQAGSV